MSGDGTRAAAAPTLAAVAFVLIWSSGFVVARAIAGRADPNLFLALRFALCIALFVLFVVARGGRWPERRAALALIGVGALVQGLYLGPGFWAVGQGLQPGVMSLIGTLQPPLTALLAWRLHGERVSAAAVLGLALGIVGVALAVVPGLGASVGAAAATTADALASGLDGLVANAGAAGTLGRATADVPGALPADAPTAALPDATPAVALVGVASVLSLTVGTLLQRRVAAVPLAQASALQTLGGFVVVATLAVALGERRFETDPTVLLALAWAVLGLSVGGFTLLMWLARGGGARRASALLLLAPPLAAVMAWVLFDDALTATQLVGFALALAGVALARR